MSFLAFCLVTETNGIQEYDIDISANSEEQAKTSFMDIWNILENPKWKDKMKRNFRWNREEIVNKKTNSKIKYRTNSPKGKDGLRSAMVCFDEVHAYENWDNIDVFTTGLGKKQHPRRIYITTDGQVRDGVVDELKNRSRQILTGIIDDNGFLPFICKLDKEEEVHNEANWYKANPSLYQNIGLLEQIRKEYQDYKLSPYTNISFMTKRCNIPKQAMDAEVTTWENILATNQPIPYEQLEGADCVIGIDYTKINDMAGVCILFRNNSKYYAICHGWMCTNSNDIDKIKAPLQQWEQMGLLTMVRDIEINPDVIVSWIDDQLSKYNFIKLGVDNFRLALISNSLKVIGIDTYNKQQVKVVRPSDIMKIVPVIDSVFNHHDLCVGDNPLFRWCTNNTKLTNAGKGNFVYDKIEYQSRKTDIFMAFVHAMIAAQDTLEDNSSSDLIFMSPLIF